MAVGDRRSTLFQLKEYPPEATPAAILDYIGRNRLLETIGIGELDLSGAPASQVNDWARLVRRYDVKELRRFTDAKRHAMLACFLVETRRSILDHLVAMNDQYLTGMNRRAKNSFEKEYRETRKRSKKSLETILVAVEILLDRERPREALLGEFFAATEAASLRTAWETCRELQRLEERGIVDRLRSRYAHLRRYLPAFFELPYQGEPGNESLLLALDLARQMNAGTLRELPLEAPAHFIPSSWKKARERSDGNLDPAVWEIALALAVRDALRSGDLYLPASRQHVSVANLLYEEGRWNSEREQMYEEFSLAREADGALTRLDQAFHEAARAFQEGLATNAFAKVEAGSLHVTRRDALEIPASVRELRRVLETSLPRVRIEDLLREVDSWCGFTKAFEPLGGYQARTADRTASLLASLVAHGTNLGIAAMGQSADGISVDQLQHVSKWFLREDTLQAANARLVDYHHGLQTSRVWGDGTLSSSDGQRFAIRSSSLLGAYYPRYFGYYERAVTVLTHTSDQFSVFGTRVISCSPREAQYVLDGLLENNTVLRPREHSTDTHGYTEHIFGLCYLVGIGFAPRLRDLVDQQLYTLDREARYPKLEGLFRERVDTSLIREQWDELARLAASLVRRTAPAHVVVQRLAGGSPSNRLARALTALGRIVKTVYILRYLHDAALRSRVQLQLNRGESRHELARRLFFADQGEFRTGDYEELMNKASCLGLLSNAVLVWNTAKLGRIVEQLRAGGSSVSDDDLSRISPLAHAHVIPNGTYHFDRPIPGDDFA